ncbi:tRNA (N(6)-L-threonylcarbamoyladenosine(37)-C(2))-methylthiotransferase MtaB [Lachnospiraceae bacterium 66-29]
MRKAALHNLGCKVNAYETESMQQLLEKAGYEIVPFEEKADVYVVNTCSVTNIADRKSRQMLHRAKKRNPDSVVVAAGCYVQTAKERALTDASVDILIGNNKKHQLPEMLEQFFAVRQEDKDREDGDAKEQQSGVCNHRGALAIVDIAKEHEYEKLSVNRTTEHTRAFLKVQDGCNQFCSYCIIPYARGRVRSRGVSEVLREVERLAASGCREIVLTGIHLSSYGLDLGTDLLSLIQKVHQISGIARIRLGSLEPKIVTEEFAQQLSQLPKLCPHFHLSLQSGCDATLQRMNRKYTCEQYAQGCELLRKYFDHPAITTDVIVGFPGETAEEFETTRTFLEQIGFFEIHIFKYSLRKGTRAAQMPQQVPEDVKHARSEQLFSDQAPRNEAFLNWYLGKEVQVLLEEKVSFGETEYLVGYTKEYVKAAVLATGELCINSENKLITARVVSKLKDDIFLLEDVSEEK